MKYLLFLIFLTFTHAEELFSQKPIIEEEAGGKMISYRFREGQHLIYDCDERHYLCVDNDGREKCAYLREQRKIEKVDNLGCAVLKSYQNHENCFKYQQKLIHASKKAPFCFISTFQ